MYRNCHQNNFGQSETFKMKTLKATKMDEFKVHSKLLHNNKVTKKKNKRKLKSKLSKRGTTAFTVQRLKTKTNFNSVVDNSWQTLPNDSVFADDSSSDSPEAATSSNNSPAFNHVQNVRLPVVEPEFSHFHEEDSNHNSLSSNLQDSESSEDQMQDQSYTNGNKTSFQQKRGNLKKNIEKSPKVKPIRIEREIRTGFKTFNNSASDVVALLLKSYTEVILIGRAMVRVLTGSAIISGFKIFPSHKDYLPVYSLPNFHYQTILTEEAEVLPKSIPYMKRLKRQLLEVFNHQNQLVDDILSYVDEETNIILLKSLVCCKEIDYACKLLGDFETLPKIPIKYPKLGFAIAPRNSTRHCCWKNQKDLVEYIIHCIKFSGSSNTPAPRILVCGPNNVGKSSLIRYCINKALNFTDHVIHLETDPGQGEFTPPGIVALTKVYKPLLGPPFTHLQKSTYGSYVGGKTVEGSSELYCKTIKYLLDSYELEDQSVPLFINTMGWVSGLGLSMLIDIIRFCKPTLIIQIKGNNGMPEMSSNFIENSFGWLTQFQTENIHSQLSCELKIIQPLNKLDKVSLSTVTTRLLSTYCYLGRLQKKDEFSNIMKPINEFIPYSVPWSAIGARCCHTEINPEDIIEALNGSLVALTNVDPSLLAQNPVCKRLPMIITDLPLNTFIGFGLVRGVDHEKEILFLITPEPLSQLQLVNALLIGKEDSLVQILSKQKVDGIIPYVSENDARTNRGLGSSASSAARKASKLKPLFPKKF